MGRSQRASAAGLVACLALPALCVLAFAGPKTTEQAGQDYQYASLLLDDLRAVPALELGKEQYILVAKAFRQVYLGNPASGYCDDSLLLEAQLYVEAAKRFGHEPYLSKAGDAYSFLVREYPSSKHKEKAAGLSPNSRRMGPRNPFSPSCPGYRSRSRRTKLSGGRIRRPRRREPRPFGANHDL